MRLIKRSQVPASGRAMAVVTTGILVLAGCPTSDDGRETAGVSSETQTSGPTTDSESGQTSETETTDATDSATSGPSGTDTASSDTQSDTDIPSGIGCGVTPPACDKGTSDASPFQLTTESQIDEIAGYTKIFGSLEINASEFECLDFLACLEDVGGNIQIFGNEKLMDLSGLDNVTTVGSEFPNFASVTIGDNPAMVDMNGLNGVQSIPVSMAINRNDAMQTVTGLSKLVVIQKDMTIRDNPVLNGLSGLHGLKAVGGKFLVTQNPMQCVSEVNMIGGSLEQWSGEGATDANDDSC